MASVSLNDTLDASVPFSFRQSKELARTRQHVISHLVCSLFLYLSLSVSRCCQYTRQVTCHRYLSSAVPNRLRVLSFPLSLEARMKPEIPDTRTTSTFSPQRALNKRVERRAAGNFLIAPVSALALATFLQKLVKVLLNKLIGGRNFSPRSRTMHPAKTKCRRRRCHHHTLLSSLSISLFVALSRSFSILFSLVSAICSMFPRDTVTSLPPTAVTATAADVGRKRERERAGGGRCTGIVILFG